MYEGTAGARGTALTGEGFCETSEATMAMLRALRKSVPLRDWPAVLAAAGVALVVEIGLRSMTLPRLSRVLGVPLRLDDGTELMPPSQRLKLSPRALRRLRATRRVLRHWPFGDTCLRRALVSGQRLRKLRPVLRVGVAKIDGRIQAHAWLEIDGVTLDAAGAALFQSFEPVAGGGTE